MIDRMWVRALLGIFLAWFGTSALAAPQDAFPRYETKYYIIQTDLAPDDARWLFAFTSPQVPPGWAATYPTALASGTVVRVR